MLVLSRRPGERIVLKLPNGEQIELLVADVHRQRKVVRIGIDAPRDVEIYRSEIMNESPGGAVSPG